MTSTAGNDTQSVANNIKYKLLAQYTDIDGNMAETHPMRSKDQIASSSFELLNKEAEARCKEMIAKHEQAPMPSLNHLKSKDYHQVYEPSDDTFLLLDALYLDFLILKDVGPDSSDFSSTSLVSLEVGCGTGVVTIFLGQILRNHIHTEENKTIINTSVTTKHFVTDINEYALQTALNTAKENSIPSDEIIGVNCDLASAFLNNDESEHPNLEKNVDILLFNPPYVPTPDEEVGSTGIEASWAGGKDGRVVVDRFLPIVDKLLKDNGVCYLITVDDNFPEEIAEIMLSSFQICMIPFLRRRANNEYLTVQKLTRVNN